MNRMIRGMRSALVSAVTVSALAITILIIPSVVFDTGTSVGSRSQSVLNSITFTRIDHPEAKVTKAIGINNNGQVVGSFGDAGDATRGFLFDDGKYTAIDFPGSTATAAYGINDAGQIVGLFDVDENRHGFLLSGGAFARFDFPNAMETVATGINNNGQIMGGFKNAKGVIGRFLSIGTGFKLIRVPGSTNPENLMGINNDGQLVGRLTNRAGTHGFLFDRENLTLVDVPKASATVASGIDDNGRVVGAFTDTRNALHGFLLSGGIFTQIDYPGARSTVASGINNNGQIVGFFIDAEGVEHGFLAQLD